MEINRFPMRLKGVFRQMIKTPGLYGLIHNIVKAAIESNMNAHLNNNPTMRIIGLSAIFLFLKYKEYRTNVDILIKVILLF